MITVYEIKSNGFIGASKEIEPKDGISGNWTYTAPPDNGSYKWEHGQWIQAIEPDYSPAAPDYEALGNAIRRERNSKLADCDWTQIADATTDKGAWKVYRQQLRDITLQEDFPLSVRWPEKP